MRWNWLEKHYVMNKVLSIIVPAYNVEQYLERGLQSLIVSDHAAFESLEVIVVNDGSKDRTGEIAHRFAADFPDVFQVVDKLNGNYGSCINVGIKIAKGTYVRILDGDDSYDTDAFENYLKFVANEARSPQPRDVIFNDFITVDPDGKLIEQNSYSFMGKEDASLADFDYQNGRVLWAPAISYRLDLLRKIDYIQTEGLSYTDQEWDTIPMMYVKSFTYCPEAIYKYLIGRVDQSCNEIVRLSNFTMHFPISEKIIRKYVDVEREKCANLSNLHCVESQIKSHIRFFYWTYLIRNYSLLDANDLRKYDAFLKCTSDSFYMYAGSLSVLKKPLTFFYVREWRSKHARKTVRFLLYDIYIRFRKCLSRWW